jgi:hypothetical protein
MFEDVKEGVDPEKDKNEYHFFYNREERLKKAPQIVQDYYNGKVKPLRGFAVFYKNKANFCILLALVFFVAVAWLYTGFNRFRNYAKINEIDCNLSAFSYADEIYVNATFNRNVKSKKTDEPDIKIHFQAINADQQVYEESDDFVTYKGGESIIRAKFPDYDIIRIDALVSVGGEEKELSAAVKR